MKQLLLVLGLVVGCFSFNSLQAQKIGIGGEISSLNLDLGSGIGSGLSVPIWLDNILIEPQIAMFSNSTSDEDSKFKSSSTLLSVGLNYGFLVENDFRSFIGANIGTARNRDMSKVNDEKESTVDASTLLGIQIGGEYFISDRFSFGLTVGYNMATSKDENDRRSTNAGIGSSAKFRFYPFQ